MESKQPDLNYQVLKVESNGIADCTDQDFIPLVNVEPNVNHKVENAFNETKMRKWIFKLAVLFILVLG